MAGKARRRPSWKAWKKNTTVPTFRINFIVEGSPEKIVPVTFVGETAKMLKARYRILGKEELEAQLLNGIIEFANSVIRAEDA